MLVKYDVDKNTLKKVIVNNITDKDYVNDNTLTITIPSNIEGIEIKTIGCFTDDLIIINDKYTDKESCKLDIIIEDGPASIFSIKPRTDKEINISIKIPASIKYIGNYSFAGLKIENIDFSESKIQKLGPKAFQGCTFYDTFIFPITCKMIESCSFFYAKFNKGIIFPKNSKLEVIEEEAFHSAILNTDNIIFPDTLMYIKKAAFVNTQCINKMTFGKDSKLESISSHVFRDSSLKSMIIKSKNGINFSENCFCSCLYLTTLDISSTKTRIIPENFCYNCKSLKQIKLPDTIYYIKDGAFKNCSLTKFIVPKHLETIGAQCFNNNNIKSIESNGPSNKIIRIGDEAFKGNKLEIIPQDILKNLKKCGGSIFALNHFKEITLEAPKLNVPLCSLFANNLSLKKVNLINNDTKWHIIHENMFKDCEFLEDINFPDTVENLSAYCFYHTGIKSLKLKNIKVINPYALGACNKLNCIDLTESINIHIKSKAFSLSSSIKTLKLPVFITTIAEDAFYSIDKKVVEKAIAECPFI